MAERREFRVEEKELPDMLIAGYRMKGRYDEIGKGFGKVCRAMGFNARGKPFALYYDEEYKEEAADYEAAVPVKKEKEVKGISVRILPGGPCLSLLHRGPYQEIGQAYRALFAHLEEKGLQHQLPTRLVFHRGPGLLFKGDPRNYLTEVQVLVAP